MKPIDLNEISYVSELPDQYARELKAATTLQALRNFAERWRPLADDAFEVVSAMSDDDFPALRVGIEKESKGKFAGEEFAERYGALMMPEVMFRAAVISMEARCPWGCAYIRMRDEGVIVVTDGIARAAKQ